MNNISNRDNTVIKSVQVGSLPIGPGGNNPTKRLMNDTNLQLTMLTAQAMANTKYDPLPPEPITKQVILENFTSDYELSKMLLIIGSLCIVYGIVAK